VFSFRWVLAEHTKDHADGSPAGGPTNPHHTTGLYPSRGRANEYRLFVDTVPKLPSEILEGSPMDSPVPPLPSLLDQEGVSRDDTPLYPQGVAPDATGGVAQRDTRGVAGRDRGVAPDATGGVAPDATPHTRHIPVNNPQARLSESKHCGEVHRAPHTGEILTCAEWQRCGFKFTEDELEVNREGIAQARAAIDALKRSRSRRAGSEGGGGGS
jgi:hypothetical protein